MNTPQVFQDVQGATSSKRVGFAVAIIFVVASWFANVVWGIQVDGNIINAFIALGGVSGAGIAMERFGRRWE